MSKAFRNRVILSTRETGRRLPLALFRISRNWPSAWSIPGGIWAVRMKAMLCYSRSGMMFQSLIAGLPSPVDGVMTEIADLTVLSGDYR